jgi:hypothetical protein
MVRPRLLLLPFVCALAACGEDRDPNSAGFGGDGGTAPGTDSGRPPDYGPKSFTCGAMKKLTLAVSPAAKIVPDIAPDGTAPAPTITSMSANAGPFGTVVEIKGSNFGGLGSGSYVSFAPSDVRLAAACPPGSSPYTPPACQTAGWANDYISFTVPFGADGDVTINTKGGSVKAGTFTSSWTATPMFWTATKSAVVRKTIGSHATSTRTYAVVLTSNYETPNNVGLGVHLVAFENSRVSSVPLFENVDPQTGSVFAEGVAAFTDTKDGTVDGGIILSGADSRFYALHIRGDEVGIDNGCIPSELALAMGTDAKGTYAWVHLPGRGMARLSYAAGTWSFEGDPFYVPAQPLIRGVGVEASDGAVGFTWSEGAGEFLDSKALVRVAWKAGGATRFEHTALTPVQDDYAYSKIFAVPSGLTVGHCNYDETGFLSDTGKGSFCHVQSLGANGWQTAAGFTDPLSSGRVFGLVNGGIASLVGSDSAIDYVTADDAQVPILVNSSNRELEFVTGSLTKAAVLGVTPSGISVIHER